MHCGHPGKRKVTASRSGPTSQSQQSRLSGGRTQCVPSISSPRGREPLPGTAQNRPGRAEPTGEPRCPHAGLRALVSPSGGDAPCATAQDALGTGASGACPLTCCAALSASSANSTDRPFSACLRDPHVLLFSEAQEGSGVVSDPRALREEEALRGRDAQARKPGGQPTRQPTSRHHAPPGRPAHLPTETPAAQRAGTQGVCEKGGTSAQRDLNHVGETQAGGSSVPGRGVGAALAGGRAPPPGEWEHDQPPAASPRSDGPLLRSDPDNGVGQRRGSLRLEPDALPTLSTLFLSSEYDAPSPQPFPSLFGVHGSE